MDTPTISSQTSLEAQVKLISVDALQQICKTNTALIDNYRQLKHRQQEAGDEEHRQQALTEESVGLSTELAVPRRTIRSG